jgi:hypothetical protein
MVSKTKNTKRKFGSPTMQFLYDRYVGKIVEGKAISELRGDKECAHYALITNSSISPSARERIKDPEVLAKLR